MKHDDSIHPGGWTPEATGRLDRLAGLAHWELDAGRERLSVTVRAPSLAALALLTAMVAWWAPRVGSLPALTVYDGWMTLSFHGHGRPLSGWDVSLAELVQVVLTAGGPGLSTLVTQAQHGGGAACR